MIKEQIANKKWLLLIVWSMFMVQQVCAQQPRIMNTAEIKINLEKLLHLGSVLYIAVHPDDENTAILAYMAKDRMMRTGYLSLTRGDGGQNLIGSEKGPLMGLIRTYELLEARKIDGAEQFFTRAIDFGYSKSADESIAIWGRENVLEDIVYVIRKFQPDIILTRFSPIPEEGNHGHHTASAILALEAFNAAGDSTRFPDQLKEVAVWKPTRLLWNTWKPYLPDAKPEETASLTAIDVGKFNPLLGKSYQEIASLSRSMHKSQGFGAVPVRGERLDYFEALAGEKADKDLFDGVDTSWDRVPGSAQIRLLLEKANQSFDCNHPEQILPILMDALKKLGELPGSYWKTQKTAELKEIIRSCSGVWLEAISDAQIVLPGQEIKVASMIVNRSDFPFRLKQILVASADGEMKIIPGGQQLQYNKPLQQNFAMTIPTDDGLITNPYWLLEAPGKGIYYAAPDGLKGMPIAPYPFNVTIVLEEGGKEISFETPVLFRQRDPVEGEKLLALTVTAPVTANFIAPIFYFPSPAPRKIEIILRCGPAPISGTLALQLPPSWKADPPAMPFSFSNAFEEKNAMFTVTPLDQNSLSSVTAAVTVNNRTYKLSWLTIEYPHLPSLALHPPAVAQFVRADIQHTGKHIGYIMGTGDDIPAYLRQIGFQVELLTDEDLRLQSLDEFDAIVIGVRAYNTRDILKNGQGRLLDYVQNGGRLIVQYSVSRGLKVQQIGPYPFQINSNRVTEEDAPMTLLNPHHPLFNHPNKITTDDFGGWVQERGLYFADKWDSHYLPLLSCHDKGEPPQQGGLLLAQYGKGIFIYTGYSFFRQIPAGIPGALKLFVNMLSLTPESQGIKKNR